MCVAGRQVKDMLKYYINSDDKILRTTANDKEVQASINYKIDDVEIKQEEVKRNGWYHENGDTYYYIDGNKVTGKISQIVFDSFISHIENGIESFRPRTNCKTCGLFVYIFDFFYDRI